jgi:hydroxymethylbilane synthase
MGKPAIRIGTRGSQLALWQAHTAAALLDRSGVHPELVIIRTTGDRIQDAPLSESGGKRLFVKEIEDALLRRDVDIAVHSAKDMSAVLPDGLALGATLPREDPRDALVTGPRILPGELAEVRAALGEAPTFGTGSVRRAAQLAALFPGASFAPIRGNVDSRLRKLDTGEYDALVLACAGLRRLGMSSRISAAIPVEDCVPAPGQGIVAIEARADDADTLRLLQSMNDRQAGVSLTAERALVQALGGGCQLPLGGLALHDNGELDMLAVVASPDGKHAIKLRRRGKASEPAALGERVADDLRRGGAVGILEAVRAAHGND